MDNLTKEKPKAAKSNKLNFACRSCASKRVQEFLSLGSVPLANSLLKKEQLNEPEEHYPLNVVYCEDCSLVQITKTVPPEKLFSHYLYLSSFSETMLKHSEKLANKLTKEFSLTGRSLVVEIASNDGYLLQYYKNQSIPVLGIEPAHNIAKIAQNKGIDTVNDFFSLELATKLASEGKVADVIHAHNVLAHVPDLNGFVSGIEKLLSPEGVAVIEAPYVQKMIDNIEFDTIYHEHLCYFSLTALKRLFENNNLVISNVEQVDIHGGSLRIYASKKGASIGSAVEELLKDEEKRGINTVSYYKDFAKKVDKLRESVVGLLNKLKSEGKSIAAYGASAKGSTMMNFFGLDSNHLDFVADRSTVKQGLYTPGNRLPIFSPEEILERMPDYLLLLTWNFADEILEQQSKYRELGGKFIVPIPKPTIL